MYEPYSRDDKYPYRNPQTGSVESPHVVILGAGASRAAFGQGDAYGKKIPVMNDILEIVGLTDLISKEGFDVNTNFEALYDDLVTNGTNPNLISQIESNISSYFQGLKITRKPTQYDYLITSLRGKDLIATFNWDPLLLQAYCRNLPLGKENLPEIVFLHGNVGVGVCEEDKTAGHIDRRCSKCALPFKPTQLLYPVKHKNYTDNIFIRDQWAVLRQALKSSCLVTIFGYSAPMTDVEARQLMLEVWRDNPTFHMADFEIIDPKPPNEIEENWDSFTYSHHWSHYKLLIESYILRFPRRSCEAFFEQTFNCAYIDGKQFPEFETLVSLHDYLQPFLEEETKSKIGQSRITLKDY